VQATRRRSQSRLCTHQAGVGCGPGGGVGFLPLVRGTGRVWYNVLTPVPGQNAILSLPLDTPQGYMYNPCTTMYNRHVQPVLTRSYHLFNPQLYRCTSFSPFSRMRVKKTHTHLGSVCEKIFSRAHGKTQKSCTTVQLERI
jgi:hypothetical protein